MILHASTVSGAPVFPTLRSVGGFITPIINYGNYGTYNELFYSNGVNLNHRKPSRFGGGPRVKPCQSLAKRNWQGPKSSWDFHGQSMRFPKNEMILCWLVVSTHLKICKSMGRIIPYIMEKNMFEPTNQLWVIKSWECNLNYI